MSVGIPEYRIRIGLFAGGLARRAKPRRTRKQGLYTPFTSSTDVHFRTLTTFLVLIPILLACKYAVVASRSDTVLYALLQLSNFSSNDTTSVVLICPFNVCQLKLLLSNDIESNPGPADMDILLKAIKDSETNLMTQMLQVQADISGLKNEVASVKNDQAAMRTDLHTVTEKQKAIERDLLVTNTKGDKLQYITETVQADVEYLSSKTSAHDEKLSDLKTNIEHLNRRAIASNMRVFGLPLDEPTSGIDLKNAVINGVLKVACPSEKWVPDDIKNVRVFQSNDSETPLVIVTFRHDDDKFRVYEGRDELRKKSIRVGDDLTYEQRKTLIMVKSRGQNGYYFRGELRIRPDNGTKDTGKQREFLTAARKLTKQGDQSSAETFGANSETMDTL